MFQKCFSISKTAKGRATILARNYQVTVVGGAGNVGQPLCLLLKSNPLVSRLSIHDLQRHTPGFSLDLSHIPSGATTKGYAGTGSLQSALTSSNIVIVCASTPRTPGSSATDDQLLVQNSKIIANVMRKVAKVCPNAFLAIVTHPLNSLVPFAAEALRKLGCYDRRKLFGVTTVNMLRAQALYAKESGVPVFSACTPVVGGNSDSTCVPLFSQTSPRGIKPEQIPRLIDTFKNRTGDRSDIISTAYAVSVFTQGLLEALAGSLNVQYAYVQNNDFGTSFFAGPVLLSSEGILEVQMMPHPDEVECELLGLALEQIRKDVIKGQLAFSELGQRSCN